MNKVLLKSVICVFFLFLSENAFTQAFYSYEQIIQNYSGRAGDNFDLVRAKKLVSELHPKLYLVNNNMLSTSVANSYYADVDVASLATLGNQQNVSGFEIIKINVKSTDQFSIDLSQLRQTYSGLKFVYVVCDFRCNVSHVQSFFVNNDPDVLIIYAISIPI